MSDWYLKDARGSEVGPLSRDVAVDLLRSKPGVFTMASRDRVTWQPVRGQVVQTLIAEDPALRRAREEQEAQRVLFELDRFRELAPHALFGVPKSATAKDYRHGFLSIGKRFHPGRLPRDASPSLVKAHMAVYQYLTEVLQKVETALSAVPPPSPSSPPPPRPSSPGLNRLPTWQLDVLHLRQEAHQVAARFEVNRQTAFVFTAHRLMNLSMSSVFFPCLPALPLGTKLGLSFEFAEAKRVVGARGAVALESASIDQTLRGFGVRLDLGTEDKGFMLREAQRLGAPAR